MLGALSPSVPRFLTLPSIGLDISDTSLKYIEVGSGHGSNRSLEQWGDISIPSGVLSRGEVLDPKQLVSVLRECREKTGAKFIRASLPEERAYLFETEVKRNASLKEIKNFLEFRLAENVPLPAQDVVFDYTLLPAAHDNDRTVRVAVTAYGKDTIQTYYDVCIEAGFQPLAFEVEAQAMARSSIADDTTGASMVVDFGKTRTGIGIVYKDVLLYTSTIDIGGDQLSHALRKTLGENTAEKELTKLKNTQGLVHGAGSSDVHDALISTMSVIKDELATRMQYWHLRTDASPDRRLSQIILCGGSANLKGLPTYLTECLKVPTVRANVWENMLNFTEEVPPIDRRHSLGYATAIGLALGSVDV